MADLTGLQDSLSTKIMGADLTGVETTSVNSNPSGSLYIDNRQLKGVDTDVNLGTASAGTQRVVLASNQTSIPVTVNSLTDAPQSDQIGSYSNANKVFSVSGTFNAALSAANNPIYLIRNPVANTKSIYLTKSIGGTVVANTNVTFKIFANPVVTVNGTVRLPVNNKIGSAVASTIEVFSLSTVSSSGVELRNSVNGQNGNSVIIEEDSAIIIPPGNSILITALLDSTNRGVGITVIWVEI